jgi:hypothetical protein
MIYANFGWNRPSGSPVRIRDRIDPPHPLVCRKRRLNGAVLRIRAEKTKAPYHSRYGTIKIPPCSKTLSAEHRPKFCSPSPVMVTSPYKWKILERDESIWRSRKYKSSKHADGRRSTGDQKSSFQLSYWKGKKRIHEFYTVTLLFMNRLCKSTTMNFVHFVFKMSGDEMFVRHFYLDSSLEQQQG